MATTKPASRYFAKAMKTSGKIYGQFAMPGIVPQLVGEHTGRATVYDNEDDAYNAACRALVAMMQARTENTQRAGKYVRMSAAEFGKALGAANITASYFAEICGVPYKRVMQWLDAEENVPHSAYMLVIALRNEQVFATLSALTERALGREQ